MSGSVTLALEHIGENYDRSTEWQQERFRRGDLRVDEMKKVFGAESRRPWVAQITGVGGQYGLKRRFLDGHKTFRDADRKGERGIKHYFHLRPGPIYEICHWTDWKTKERYFCWVEDGTITRISKDEVTRCLSADSA